MRISTSGGMALADAREQLDVILRLVTRHGDFQRAVPVGTLLRGKLRPRLVGYGVVSRGIGEALPRVRGEGYLRGRREANVEELGPQVMQRLAEHLADQVPPGHEKRGLQIFVEQVLARVAREPFQRLDGGLVEHDRPLTGPDGALVRDQFDELPGAGGERLPAGRVDPHHGDEDAAPPRFRQRELMSGQRVPQLLPYLAAAPAQEAVKVLQIADLAHGPSPPRSAT